MFVPPPGLGETWSWGQLRYSKAWGPGFRCHLPSALFFCLLDPELLKPPHPQPSFIMLGTTHLARGGFSLQAASPPALLPPHLG